MAGMPKIYDPRSKIQIPRDGLTPDKLRYVHVVKFRTPSRTTLM